MNDAVRRVRLKNLLQLDVGFFADIPEGFSAEALGLEMDTDGGGYEWEVYAASDAADYLGPALPGCTHQVFFSAHLHALPDEAPSDEASSAEDPNAPPGGEPPTEEDLAGEEAEESEAEESDEEESEEEESEEEESEEEDAGPRVHWTLKLKMNPKEMVVLPTDSIELQSLLLRLEHFWETVGFTEMPMHVTASARVAFEAEDWEGRIHALLAGGGGLPIPGGRELAPMSRSWGRPWSSRGSTKDGVEWVSLSAFDRSRPEGMLRLDFYTAMTPDSDLLLTASRRTAELVEAIFS